jgi:hypothetical protein
MITQEHAFRTARGLLPANTVVRTWFEEDTRRIWVEGSVGQVERAGGKFWIHESDTTETLIDRVNALAATIQRRLSPKPTLSEKADSFMEAASKMGASLPQALKATFPPTRSNGRAFQRDFLR